MSQRVASHFRDMMWLAFSRPSVLPQNVQWPSRLRTAADHSLSSLRFAAGALNLGRLGFMFNYSLKQELRAA
jgi:hypothetical protein